MSLAPPSQVDLVFLGAMSRSFAEGTLETLFSKASIKPEDMNVPTVNGMGPFTAEMKTEVNGNGPKIMNAFLDAVEDMRQENANPSYPSGSNWTVLCDYKNGKVRKVNFIRNDFLLLFQ